MRPAAGLAAAARQYAAAGNCPPPPLLSAGYARVAAAVFAFGVALHSPGVCVLAYFASFVCDELDGRFARKFNQCSTLGSGEAAASSPDCFGS